MNQFASLPQLPSDPRPSKADLEAILRPQQIRYLDDCVARCIAAAIWRGRRSEADPDAFSVPLATEVRVFPDGHLTLDGYLEDDLWNSIRRRVLERADDRCECCGAWANDIHIRDYRPRVLRGEDLLPLVAVCRSCQQYIHEDPVAGRTRERHAERESALAEIYGRFRSRAIEVRRIASWTNPGGPLTLGFSDRWEESVRSG